MEKRDLLTRFGRRFSEVIRDAEERAEALRHEQERPRSATELVDEAVGEYVRADSVAQELGHAFTRALGGTGTVGGYRFEVTTTYDMASMAYDLEIRDRRFGSKSEEPRRFWVAEETLARRTLTVSHFNEWISSCAARLKPLFTLHAAQSDVGNDGWLEAKLVTREPTAEVIREALEDLEKLGLHGTEALQQPLSDEEEREAIALIMQEFNRADQ